MWILLWGCAEPSVPVAPTEPNTSTDAGTETDGTTTGVPGPDTEDTGTPPIDTGPPPGPAWDSSPPDVNVGAVVPAVITCSLFLEPVDAEFTKLDDPWMWDLHLSDGGGLRIPGLEPCYEGNGQSLVLWDDTRISIITGNGVLHTLEPTVIQYDWAGTVVPAGESSPECTAALESFGLAWPLPIRMAIIPKAEGS
jgi:hypothetical protein